MAKLSNDKTYVIVESGDTLSAIARDYFGGASKYPQLAALNNLRDANVIHVGQKIMLTKSGSSSSGGKTNSNNPTVTQFGILSTSADTLLAVWTWAKQSQTASYKVQWTYDTGDGVWLKGEDTSINVDKDAPELSRQSTYTIPANAKRVRFRVLPISETYTKNNKETVHWTANWSKEWEHTNKTPLTKPSSAPNVEIEKYKLTASLDNVNIIGATHIEFQVVKDNSSKVFATKKTEIVTGHASHAFTVDAGAEYKVRCRAYSSKDKIYSDWTDYSSNTFSIPATPSELKVRANSETSVYLEWKSVPTATKYDIEYATKKTYFDGSDQTTTKTGIEFTHFEITGLETGAEYFFRVRAVNTKGESGWSEIKSTTIGKDPAAPTTWSSSTTVISGEPLTLYWMHNAEDGSSETVADLELYINGVKETHTITKSTDEDEKDKTSFFEVDTSAFIEGTQIQWRVRTAGITKRYGDWSIQRTVDIYAPVTLELSMVDGNGNPVETLASFPFYISALPGPKTQAPIGYHLVITSNDIYETVDDMGNPRMVNSGEELYSKHFDINTDLMVEMSAHNLNLENNASYTVSCTVSMNSGLTTTKTLEFTVTWTDEQYTPNAEIGIDEESLTAYIRPYCEDRKVEYRKVKLSAGVYTVTDEVLDGVYGSTIKGKKTTTGEQVYSGTTTDDETVYYCEVEEVTPVTDILLSVYRREFDGTFTEIASGLDSSKYTTVTDPHPALDYARYRIVATSKVTGAISYYDPPGYPVGSAAVVIQWDEEWSEFETSETAPLEQPPWSGSLLKLPYNIDVSDDNSPDVVLVNYAGREHPTAYYGTQLGHKATWNIEIDKNDKETLYALRRLQRWMGDVYVREPSGSGYWASILVSFSQKHTAVTIPVALSITRVEGGV